MANNKQPELSTKGTNLFVTASIIIISILMWVFSTENYSNGERIGFVTKFSSKGRFYKSWEGELNLTQTGMNTSSLFDFSLDNDIEDKKIIAKIDSAASLGWKVKLKYHQVSVKNFFDNRGETNYFVTNVEVLDKNAATMMFGNNRQGKIIDTIFVVIDKSQLKK